MSFSAGSATASIQSDRIDGRATDSAPQSERPAWPRGELRGAAGAWQALLSGGGLLRCVGDELGRWQGHFPDLARPSHQDRLKEYRGGHRA